MTKTVLKQYPNPDEMHWRDLVDLITEIDKGNGNVIVQSEHPITYDYFMILAAIRLAKAIPELLGEKRT